MNSGNSLNFGTYLQIASLILTVFLIPMVKYIVSRELKSLKAADEENKNLLENFIKAVNERFEKIEACTKQELESIKKELNQFKADAPLIYVLRDDFIRAIGTFERKLDKMLEWMATMTKKGE